MKINSIYKKTLFDYRKSAFFWSLGIILIGLMYASLYPSFSGTDLSKVLEGAPAAINAFIGSAEFFATPDGFIHGEFFTLTMPLILCILAITIASGLIAKEEESGTAELILARPVSRNKILRGKLLGMVSVVGALSFSVWLGLFFGRVLVDQFKITLPSMALASLNLFLLAITFGCITFMITSLKSRRALASGVAGTYFLLSYIIGTFGAQVAWVGHFKVLSLFNYYNTADILQRNIHWWDFVVLAAVAVTAYILAEILFARRDTGK